MDRYGSNYEALKVIHEARMQQVRASAVAAGLNRRDRDAGALRRLAHWLVGSGPHARPTAPRASTQRFFWA